MYGPAQLLSGMLPGQSDMLPGPAEGSSSGAGVGAGQGQVDRKSVRQSKSTGGPARQHEEARTGMEASGGDGVEEGAEAEGSEEETGPGKNFEDKLQELKEYKRRHGEGVHVVLCAGCSSLAGDEGAPGLIASWCTRAGRPRLPSGSSSHA